MEWEYIYCCTQFAIDMKMEIGEDTRHNWIISAFKQIHFHNWTDHHRSAVIVHKWDVTSSSFAINCFLIPRKIRGLCACWCIILSRVGREKLVARNPSQSRYFPNICGGFKLSLCWSKHFSVMACNRYHHRTPRGTATATITPSPQYNTQHIIMAAVVHVATDNCKKMDSVPQRFYSRLWRPLGNQRC